MKKSVFMMAMSLLVVATLLSCEREQKPSFPGYTPTGSGLYYKEIVKGSGEQTKMDDIIFIRLAYYINDSLLYTTDSVPGSAIDQVHESVFKGDLYEAFAMMHVGDSMSFMINADSIYRKQFRKMENEIPGFVTPEAFLRWEIVIDSAMSPVEYTQMKVAKDKKAREDFDAYLTAKGVKESSRQESGFYYVRTQKGKGPRPGYKQKVIVHYTGTFLDGTKFDSSYDRNKPIDFSLGVGQVIKGWDEGIALMSKGEKGILYIPYYLAYGDRVRGPIPAYSNLVFEVELVDFE